MFKVRLTFVLQADKIYGGQQGGLPSGALAKGVEISEGTKRNSRSPVCDPPRPSKLQWVLTRGGSPSPRNVSAFPRQIEKYLSARQPSYLSARHPT
jgi:hypothetical protein